MKEVTAAIILKDNRVLIAQRAPDDKLANKWEFPGGKIESGETPQECLKREIREELDVDLEVLDFFAEIIYKYSSGIIKLMAFWCKWISGDFTLKVHSQITWVNHKELDIYDFAPADIPLAEKLIINAAHGVGEALVQGEIIPDQWLARRPDGAVLKFTPAPKKVQSPSPFIRTQRPARGCLTSQEVRELACLCLRIEEHFNGVPQDIEWSYGFGEFYLLQSRPITTLKA